MRQSKYITIITMVAALEGSVFMFSMYSSLQEAKNRAHAIVMIVMYLDFS